MQRVKTVKQIVVRQSLLLACLLMANAAAQPALAATWAYDFSGNLASQFSQLMDTPAPSIAVQSGGQMLFHTQGQQFTTIDPNTGNLVFSDTNEIFGHKLLLPTFNQSWDLHIDATVPISIDATLPNLPNQPNGQDWYMEVGIGAFFFKADGTQYTLGSTLGIGSGQDRRFNGEYGITPLHGEWTEHLINQGNRETTNESGLLGLSFDATTKVLTTYSGQDTLLSLDLDAPGITNWGMTGSDRFMIFLGSSIQGWAVPENTPLSLDNFSATVQAVPEPETYVLMLAGLGLVGFAARRGKKN